MASSSAIDSSHSTAVACAVVLAAGLGTRMKSLRPKVAHAVCGVPIVEYVLRACRGLGLSRIVVVLGHEHEQVRALLPSGCEVALQQEQRGTGHAFLCAAPYLPDTPVLVLPGDTPLVTTDLLADLVRRHEESGADASLLTMRLDDPADYGRVIRDPQGTIRCIVERKDADPTQLAITEVNSGVYVLPARRTTEALAEVGSANAQGEIYLTDVIGHLAAAGGRIYGWEAPDASALLGVNTREELAQAEQIMNQRLCAGWMAAGVTIERPEATQLHSDVVLEPDVVIAPFSAVRGRSVVGRGTRIGPGTTLIDTIVGRDCELPCCYLEGVQIEDGSVLAPFTSWQAGHCGWVGNL